MTTLPASTPAPQPRASTRGLWLISPFYDLTFIIFSSVLLILPHLASQFALSLGGDGWLNANVVVDLIVTAFIGGPHLFATYTMTFMEPRFRERYKRYTWGALLMPVIVVTLAIVNLTLLVTIFFFWASVHVIHQAAYIADSYRFKDTRTGEASLKRAQLISRVIDYGLLMTSLYPIATFRFTGTPLWLFGEKRLETLRDGRPHTAVPGVSENRVSGLSGDRRIPVLPGGVHCQNRLGSQGWLVSRSENAAYGSGIGAILRDTTAGQSGCRLPRFERLALVSIPGGRAVPEPRQGRARAGRLGVRRQGLQARAEPVLAVLPVYDGRGGRIPAGAPDSGRLQCLGN